MTYSMHFRPGVLFPGYLLWWQVVDCAGSCARRLREEQAEGDRGGARGGEDCGALYP